MSKVVRSSSESEVQLWETEEDDMTEGDLGYGLGRRPGGIYEVEISQLLTSRKRSDGKNFSAPPLPRKEEERSGGIFQYSKHKSVQDTYPQGSRISSYRRQSSTDSTSELSTEELRQYLHETLEEVEILKTELEASQRQLESKEEALKILQSMAILGKATSHTQAVLQKTMEQKRFLEKEINALQWEIEFDQNRFKNIEESWTKKCDSFQFLNQQYLEVLAMLDIKQQKMAQENMCHDKSGFAEVSGLELAVLGACICHGPGGSPCSCAKMAASTRKLLLQLKQEVLHYLNSNSFGHPSQRSKKTLGQKLLGMLPSENSSKRTEDQDNPQEVFKILIDLLNDKEEALAHQRKVSYMLAQALEDKNTVSKESEEKNPMKANFPFKNPRHKTSEFSVLHDPVHSSVQTFNSVGCICSNQHPQTDPNYTRTLKRSCSLPSSIIF
ncbi:PREDICTED: coiled-coil domain-containing protein 125 [Propithecus coquereli]|uniref:coiled-coil domain-containing protein 125 n=1 Tax=Propithecus coquereli TaxID=379532 RepID=UPI00063F7A23|nr:PREDICTED: coiled-coil domain-containing protein 125 [Propithecus coquereli]